MRLQAYQFYLLGAFFLLSDVVYWFWSQDPTGTTVLGLTFGFVFLIGFYIHFITRRIGRQPEDNPHGEVSDGAGEIGFYSPHSWWPFFTAGAMAILSVGLVIGWWLFLIGIMATVAAAIGFVFEYYRGHFSH